MTIMQIKEFLIENGVPNQTAERKAIAVYRDILKSIQDHWDEMDRAADDAEAYRKERSATREMLGRGSH